MLGMNQPWVPHVGSMITAVRCFDGRLRLSTCDSVGIVVQLITVGIMFGLGSAVLGGEALARLVVVGGVS